MTRQEADELAAIAASALPPAGPDYYIYTGMLMPKWLYHFRHIAYIAEAIKERKWLYALAYLAILLSIIIPDFTGAAEDAWGVGNHHRQQQIFMERE